MVDKSIIKDANGFAWDIVSGKSDWWIQRTNVWDPGFLESGEYEAVRRGLSDLVGGDAPSVIRSAFLNAMQRAKEDRIRKMAWDPYNTKPVHDLDPMHPYLTV